MIKIIKEGTRKQIQCFNCGCIFIYEDEDIFLSFTNNKQKSVMCPQCNKEVMLGGIK